MKPNILFLCTGNSCRSQMAEGWAKALMADRFNFYSAGIIKQGVNPIAVKVMQQAGVDISQQQSISVDDLPPVKMDYVITLCGNAHETCPVFPGGKIIHVGFDDPPSLSKEITDPIEVLAIYSRVRDEIKHMLLRIDDILKA